MEESYEWIIVAHDDAPIRQGRASDYMVGDSSAAGPWRHAAVPLSLNFLRRRGLRTKLRSLIWAVAPISVVYEAQHRRAQSNRSELRSTASDVMWIKVDEGLSIATCWSDVPGVGSGPSASVYAGDAEVLRLDCFGDDRGHMHVNPLQSEFPSYPEVPRFFFSPGDRAAHVDRASFELVRNLRAALASNALARIRRTPVDPEKLRVAAGAMHERMLKLVDVHSASPRAR